MTTLPNKMVGREASSRKSPEPWGKVLGARAAANRAVSGNAVALDLLGRRVELPPADQLAFLAGLGVLAACEIIEWPVALAVAIGHELAHSHHSRVLREFGNALEEA